MEAVLPQAAVTPLSQVARLGGAYAASNVARVAFGLVTSLVIARGLGPESFGHWALWTAWAAALTMACDCGFGVLVTRDAARQPEAAGRLVAAAIAVRLSIFAPVAVAVVLAAPWLEVKVSAAVVRLIVALVAAGLAYGSLAAGFKAWPRWVPLILAIETAGAGLGCAGAAVVVFGRGDAVALMAVALVIQVAQLAAALLLWQRVAGMGVMRMPGPREGWQWLCRAWPFALSGLIANGQARVAPLMLGACSSSTQVALFAVASRFAEAVKMLPQAALAGALPVLSASATDLRDGDLRAPFHARLRLFARASGSTLALLAYPLVRLTFGVRYLEAWPVLVILAIGLTPALTNSARKVYLFAGGHEDAAARWGAVALVIQTALAAALAPAWGALGVALALTIGEGCVVQPLRRAAGR